MKINTTKLRGLGVKVSLVPGLISWILALALGSSAVVAQATQEILNVRERNVDASRGRRLFNRSCLQGDSQETRRPAATSLHPPGRF
jgi:hypothetical protein